MKNLDTVTGKAKKSSPGMKGQMKSGKKGIDTVSGGKKSTTACHGKAGNALKGTIQNIVRTTR